MQLIGIHHLTAITAQAGANFAFYTDFLGMRLVKKTVNQDDVSAYHLFYADGRGSPGTDLTFFDWPAAPERRGTRSIVRTSLRVAGPETLAWWADRLDQRRLPHSGLLERDDRQCLDFEDPEGQRLSLVADQPSPDAAPWEKSPVPPEHQIQGLGPIHLSVPLLGPTKRVLTEILEMREARTYRASGNAHVVHVFEMGPGGAAAELHVAVEPDLPPGRPGAGGAHHVAFRTPNLEEHQAWVDRLARLGVPSSGAVERFYFRSLYLREPNGIRFEIATDGPGFAADEPLESLGQSLSLPPFLESRRAEIEAGLQPLQKG